MKKKVLISLFVCASLICACVPVKSQETGNAESSSKSVEIESEEIFFDGVIENDILRTNLVNALREIGVDPSNVLLEQTEDWAGGQRYSFVYKYFQFLVYCNTDGTVENINQGNSDDRKVYMRGYEPYSIEDYIVNDTEKERLIQIAEDVVPKFLNYPDSADFALLDWSFGRDHELYYVGSTLTASNGFGVKDDIPFTVGIHVANDKATPFAVEMNGAVVWSVDSGYVAPERQQVEITDSGVPFESAESGAIVLIDGEAGEYGTPAGEEDYFYYKIPSGTYNVMNNGQYGNVYVVGDGNSDDVRTNLQFKESGETGSITVDDDAHIELSMYTKVTLTPAY